MPLTQNCSGDIIELSPTTFATPADNLWPPSTPITHHPKAQQLRPRRPRIPPGTQPPLLSRPPPPLLDALKITLTISFGSSKHISQEGGPNRRHHISLDFIRTVEIQLRDEAVVRVRLRYRVPNALEERILVDTEVMGFLNSSLVGYLVGVVF